MAKRWCSVAALGVLGLCSGCPDQDYAWTDFIENMQTVEIDDGWSTTIVAGRIQEDGTVVWGGDIIASFSQDPTRGLYTSRIDQLWPGGRIPYDVSGAPVTRALFESAAATWSEETGLEFVVRTNEPDYIAVVDITSSTVGGRSFVGRAGGRQVLELSTTGGLDDALHEIGHAIGLLHEHQRRDRDEYVVFLDDNIDPEADLDLCNPFQLREDFEIVGLDGLLSGPYDIKSIMHYGSMHPCGRVDEAGALQPLLTLPSGAVFLPPSKLSEGDICSVLEMYDLDGFYDRGCYQMTPDCRRTQGRFTWSCQGPVADADCVRIVPDAAALASEPAWDDNYICTPSYLGSNPIRWFTSAPPPAPQGYEWSCATFDEPFEPVAHGWADNAICTLTLVPGTYEGVSSCLRFVFSSDGPRQDLQCLQLHEPDDPHSWGDNYLCWHFGCGG